MKNGNNGSKIPSSGGKIPRFTKSDHDALAEIFKKIGQKELTKQGLQELYNFKQQNPHADLEPFLVKSSDYFRNYIERGLKSIEAEAQNANAEGRVLADMGSENHEIGGQNGGSGGAAPHLLYLDRLKKLRAQGGLDRTGSSSASSGIGTTSTSSVYRIAATSSTQESYSSSRSNFTVSSETETESTSSSSTLTAGSAGQPDVDAIRRRLERIKASGNL